MSVTNEQNYYFDQISPMINHQKIRASARRSLRRLALLTPRHLLHLRLYKKLMTTDQLVKTMARDLVIVPKMVGRKIMVHSGKKYVMVIPSEKEVGLRLGQMAYPKLVSHKHTSKTRVKTVAK